MGKHAGVSSDSGADLAKIGEIRAGKHAAPREGGRHAAQEPVETIVQAESMGDPANLGPITGPILTPTGRARLAARLAASTALVGMGVTAAWAAGGGPGHRTALPVPPKAPETAQQPLVVPEATLKQPKVTVKRLPAAPKRKPVPIAKVPQVQVPPTYVVPPAPERVNPVPPPAPPVQVAPAPPVRVVPAPQPVPVVPAPAPKPVVPAPKPVVPTLPSSKAAGIAAAARAQLGRIQDCTRLASNALAAVGINFHGWPAGYLGLGRQVSAAEAIPGDLAYYQNGGAGVAHIAVYVGNGQAVHGGWNGNQTVVFSANVGSGPVFIRVY